MPLKRYTYVLRCYNVTSPQVNYKKLQAGLYTSNIIYNAQQAFALPRLLGKHQSADKL